MINIMRKARERRLFSILWVFITVATVLAIVSKNYMGIGTTVIIWLVLTYQVLKD